MQGNAELWAKGIASLVRDHVERATAPLREEVAGLRVGASSERNALSATQLAADGLRDDVDELKARETPDPEAFVERLANALTARLIA
jgi:hypothetical protein